MFVETIAVTECRRAVLTHEVVLVVVDVSLVALQGAFRVQYSLATAAFVCFEDDFFGGFSSMFTFKMNFNINF